MNKAVLPLLAIALIALVLASGCVFLPEVGAVEKVKESPSVASFLAEHPNAQLSLYTMSAQQSRQREAELKGKCGPDFVPDAYYYVLFAEGVNTVEALVKQGTGAIVCIHRSDDLCVHDSLCEDGNPCTVDSCMGIPKKCSRTTINRCSAGDDCCPELCDYEQDLDCPMPECAVDADCDDVNAETADVCVIGRPNVCSNEPIVECKDDDGYCPAGCHFGNDNECIGIAECETSSDCDDGRLSTTDTCSGDPGVCSHRETTECTSMDNYCPIGCDYDSDWDCPAALGNLLRLTVECRGNEAELNATLSEKQEDGRLRTSFNHFVTNANNEGLKSYTEEVYTYNGKETQIDISEKIAISATGFYNQQNKQGELYIREGRISYIVDFGEGIPATSQEGGELVFEAGNDDKIIVPLFGSDAVVALVDKDQGKVEMVSDQRWGEVDNGEMVTGLAGKGGESYYIELQRCDPGTGIFVLKEGDTMVANQEAGAGDILFPDELKKTLRINYYHREAIAGICDYRYSLGNSLEKIYDGQSFPGEGGEWKSEMTFTGNKLTQLKISNSNDKWFDNPVKSGESISIMGEEGTFAEDFCTLTFTGLIK